MTSIVKHTQVVITGTGRSGTTVLIELLTKLGMNTGFVSEDLNNLKNQIARAGLERRVGVEPYSYIVKDPSFIDYAATVFGRDDLDIEHIFIPIRDIEAVANSRRQNQRAQFKRLSFKHKRNYLRQPWLLEGGLLGTKSLKKGKQEAVLLQRLYDLLLEAAKYQVPVTFIEFPDLVHRPDYLYEKLEPIMKGVEFSEFLSVFNSVVTPEMISN